MGSPTKTPGQVLFAFAEVPGSGSTSWLQGSAINVGSYSAMQVFGRMGRTSATPFTFQPIIRVQGNSQPYSGGTYSNDSEWYSLVRDYNPQLGSNLSAEALTSSPIAGASSFTIAAAGNFAAGDFAFCLNATPADSDWVQVAKLASTTITTEEPLINAQTTSTSTLYRGAEYYPYNDEISLRGIQQVRYSILNPDTIPFYLALWACFYAE